MDTTSPISSGASARIDSRQQWIALVGPEDEENLGLRYLAGSLKAAGFSAHVIPCSREADLARVVDQREKI